MGKEFLCGNVSGARRGPRLCRVCLSLRASIFLLILVDRRLVT